MNISEYYVLTVFLIITLALVEMASETWHFEKPILHRIPNKNRQFQATLQTAFKKFSPSKCAHLPSLKKSGKSSAHLTQGRASTQDIDTAKPFNTTTEALGFFPTRKMRATFQHRPSLQNPARSFATPKLHIKTS